jgi:DNA primase
MVTDIEHVLEVLEIDVEVKNHEALGLCPMHKERTGKEDNSPSWWINLNTGQHICFSCGYKGSLVALVCDVKKFHIKSWGDLYEPDYEAARIWLASITEITAEQLAERLNRTVSRIEEAPKPVTMSEARLAVFVNPPLDKLEERKLSLESAIAYEIMWDCAREAWVLPFRDPDTNKFLGWQEKGTKDRTFMNRPPGLPRSKTLFGLNQIREDVVYLVESPLDCARMYTAGFAGAVAICGSSMNEAQIKLVRNTDRIIAAFDNPKVDPAGKKASDELRKLALKYGLNLSFFNYGDTGKKDPGDLTDEEIAWGISNSKSFLLGESAYV